MVKLSIGKQEIKLDESKHFWLSALVRAFLEEDSDFFEMVKELVLGEEWIVKDFREEIRILFPELQGLLLNFLSKENIFSSNQLEFILSGGDIMKTIEASPK